MRVAFANSKKCLLLLCLLSMEIVWSNFVLDSPFIFNSCTVFVSLVLFQVVIFWDLQSYCEFNSRTLHSQFSLDYSFPIEKNVYPNTPGVFTCGMVVWLF